MFTLLVDCLIDQHDSTQPPPPTTMMFEPTSPGGLQPGLGLLQLVSSESRQGEASATFSTAMVAPSPMACLLEGCIYTTPLGMHILNHFHSRPEHKT